MKLKFPYLICLVFLSLGLSAQSDRFKKKSEAPEAPKQEQEPTSQAQKQPELPPTIWDRIVFGGGAGLSFGVNTNVFLAPQVGYKVTDNFIAGLGYMYNYTKWDQILTLQGPVEVDFENQVHGPNLFATVTVFKQLFFGSQFEVLNHDAYIYQPFQGSFNVENRWSPVLWIQGGFYTPIGRKGMSQIGLRLNLLHDEFSPYATSWTPIFQIYF